MTTAKDETADTGNAAASFPNPMARTVVNFLLFVHLFTVGVLFFLNGSSDYYSGLRHRLRKMPGYYLQVLGMDFDFDSGQQFNTMLQSEQFKQQLRVAQELLKNDVPRQLESHLTQVISQQGQNLRLMDRRGLYHMTLGDPTDVSHYLQIYVGRNENQRNASADGETSRDRWRLYVPFLPMRSEDVDAVVTLPNDSIWPRQRALRYHMLGREIDRLSKADRVADILPASIMASVVKRFGYDPSSLHAIEPRPQFNCLRLTVKSLDDALNPGVGMTGNRPRDPFHPRYFETAYSKIPMLMGNSIGFYDGAGAERDFAPQVGTRIQPKASAAGAVKKESN